MRLLRHAVLIRVALLAAVPCTTSPAHAEWSVGGEAGVASAASGVPYTDVGADFGVVVGRSSSAGDVHWQPELVLAMAFFGTKDGFAPAHDLVIYRGLLGLRGSYGSWIRPGLSLHGGLGHANTYLCNIFPVAFDVEGASQSASTRLCQAEGNTSVMFDMGAFVDVELMDGLMLGPRTQYSYLHGSGETSSLGWFTLGAQLAVTL